MIRSHFAPLAMGGRLGERFEVYMSQQLVNQLNYMHNFAHIVAQAYRENHTEAEVKAFEEMVQLVIWQTTLELLQVEEEMFAEWEQVPTARGGGYRHNWGTADSPYKSEAIDVSGMRYLLGVFDMFDEATRPLDEWNLEYEKGSRGT